MENWDSLIITFEDGTRGIAWASDAVLGGRESSLDVFLSNARIRCTMEHTNLVQAFAPDPAIFKGRVLDGEAGDQGRLELARP